MLVAYPQVLSYLLEKGRDKAGETSGRRSWRTSCCRLRRHVAHLLCRHAFKSLADSVGSAFVDVLQGLVGAQDKALKGARIRQPFYQDLIGNIIRYA